MTTLRCLCENETDPVVIDHLSAIVVHLAASGRTFSSFKMKLTVEDSPKALLSVGCIEVLIDKQGE